MHVSSKFHEERAELEAVIASGMFHKAPNLRLFLTYVCRQYFEGQAEHVKEYTIATEALGRALDFDQKTDSIVRVEAHRLRKRLLEYYEGQGAEHSIRIVLLPGQYVPQFVRTGGGSSEIEPEPREEPGEIDVRPVPAGASLAPSAPRRRWGLLASALLVAAVGLLAAAFLAKRVGRVETGTIAPPGPRGSEIRFLAGWAGAAITDPSGFTWQPEPTTAAGYPTNYSGHKVEGAVDARLFQTGHEGDFEYAVPLNPGYYELHLHFAEMLFGEGNLGGGGEGTRVFHVDANGKRLLEAFDIISDAAGSNRADERVFKGLSPAADGKLHLKFTHQIRDPMVNAIEILPTGDPNRQRPVRLVMGPHAFTDRDGNVWEADRYFRGGQAVARAHEVSQTPNPGLYRSARCGHLSYTIPVSPGSYTLKLYFAEGWIGAGNPVGGGVGGRLFHVIVNAEMMSRNFDIYKEAGGAERAVEVTYRGLHPNPQGKLSIYLQPVRSYACINAIEVLDEGR